jgi:glycosyltransferase involved in cell wall biosynthesis
MPTITKSHPDVRLSIVGSGPDAAALHDEVAAHNLEENVEFLGAIPQHQLPELYRRATIFVAPSIETKAGHQEGLGLVAIEAIGCGCPALVSDLPGTRDVVPQKTCRVTPGSPSELSTAILKILAMPPITRKKLASRQREFIKGRFDWRFSAESYCQMIKSCMSGK